MRIINVSEITKIVSQLCISANCNLGSDIKGELEICKNCTSHKLEKEVLDILLENAKIAEQKNMPICQDTGMAIIFVDIGQNVHFEGGLLEDAINSGVALGYTDMRKSIVSDPLIRENTKDNTPAVIYYNIVAGDSVKITVMPKGFGSENMSALKMLTPSDGEQGVIDFVIDTVKKAGPNPCPPIVVGVGIGGSMDKASVISKTALLRDIDSENPNPYYANMEKMLKDKINALGIGAQGFGGSATVLGVNIQTYPTHIAGLPVAVTISCNVTRHKSKVI